MIYYFGWVVLSLGLGNDDFTEEQREQLLADVDTLLMPVRKNFQLCERRQQNYLDTLFISSAHNHDIGYKDGILSIYRQIGVIAPGSYGLLYIREPESPESHNQFKVFRLAKGVLTSHDDTLLSPCIPNIELE